MDLRCRKNLASHQISPPQWITERCLESPGLREVVISFFPGGTPTNNVTTTDGGHHYGHRRSPQSRQTYSSSSYFLLKFGVLLVAVLLSATWFISARNNNAQNSGLSPPPHTKIQPGPEVGDILANKLAPSGTTTPGPDLFEGATTTTTTTAANHAGDGLTLPPESVFHQRKITFCFDDDTETLLESIDLF
ncbi:uncharacterized protein LOC110856876 [Folsomia candida]|uniref:uncharacterized protein LOC110856876 n=1 Tax=Folsomia candida TaxID=158441 RepID=UPI000B8FED0C|nr:uncharacterized protein LOC110856876 [Folsomia candida]XP_035713279.1 uncharacterized protein LOC110856876 [Folsomia candida]XP_035713280.1 uncharacterized protein LOC110856876 [Folsomia candida]